jgi:UDP-2-acetamido-3-amino-2,3-dideoxy-glucuronate N-acetyltransferase
MTQSTYFIHPSAYVDESCQIGYGTRIWRFRQIMAHARIGERCNLGQNVLVSKDAVIGNNVKVQNNVRVEVGSLT